MKRSLVTLYNGMIRFEYRGVVIQCTDVQDAHRLLRMFAGVPPRYPENPWHPVLFEKFTCSLGPAQTKVLQVLLNAKRLGNKVSDEELRAAVEVTSNKRLGGILSGISKQAKAVKIPARSVYKIEIEFAGGKRMKFYELAEEFHQVAREHWLVPMQRAAVRSTSGTA